MSEILRRLFEDGSIKDMGFVAVFGSLSSDLVGNLERVAKKEEEQRLLRSRFCMKTQLTFILQKKDVAKPATVDNLIVASVSVNSDIRCDGRQEKDFVFLSEHNYELNI